MKLFPCPVCQQVIFFENTRCEKCGHRLGLDCASSASPQLLALSEAAGGGWVSVQGKDAQPVSETRLLFCANAAHGVCNWLVAADTPGGFCLACRPNRVIPDLAKDGNLALWGDLERAKHRLAYSLMRLNLPFGTDALPLIFDFPDDPPGGGGPRVLTGHDNGVITIALREADDAEREKMRLEMGEDYRTLLGHFRHEVGHYYWDLLVRDGGQLEACRAVFGDDSIDYAEALRVRYENGPLPNWRENFVSAYAATHPWEDFAESWAHYLHIVDTLETAMAYGLVINPLVSGNPSMSETFDFDPYQPGCFDHIEAAWIPLTQAVNSLNRSMGQPDLYPFVLTKTVMDKLRFIDGLVHGYAG